MGLLLHRPVAPPSVLAGLTGDSFPGGGGCSGMCHFGSCEYRSRPSQKWERSHVERHLPWVSGPGGATGWASSRHPVATPTRWYPALEAHRKHINHGRGEVWPEVGNGRGGLGLVGWGLGVGVKDFGAFEGAGNIPSRFLTAVLPTATATISTSGMPYFLFGGFGSKETSTDMWQF